MKRTEYSIVLIKHYQ